MEDWIIVLVLCLLLGVPALIITLPLIIDRYRIEYKGYNRKTDDVILPILQSFQFYTKLSDKAKTKFVRRVRFIASDKNFIGREGLEVTDFMRVRIAASIAQISFGLNSYKLLNIKKIILYPEIFFSPAVQQNVKGLTGKGFIALSWRDFEEGYADANDNYNLGLHEIAHALQISAGYDQSETNSFQFFQENTKEEFLQLKNGESTFLRSYGATNSAEFFAVCVEHFFESPDEFKRQMPDLYVKLTFLLNLDPLEDRNDYIPNFKSKQRILVKEAFGARPNWFQRKNMDLVLTFIGVFCGTFTLNMLTENFALNYVDKIVAILFLSMVPFAAHQWAKRKGYYQHFFIYALFSVFGFAMNLLVFIIICNQLLPATLSMETHKVVGASMYEGMRESYPVLELENHAYHRYPEFLRTASKLAPQPYAVQFYIRKGFTGIPEIQYRTFVLNPKN